MSAARSPFSSAWYPNLIEIPIECYSLGTAVLEVINLEPRYVIGRYNLQSESEAYRAIALLGRGYDVIVTTRSAVSMRLQLDSAGREALEAFMHREVCQ